jgi:hypothetical protein
VYPAVRHRSAGRHVRVERVPATRLARSGDALQTHDAATKIRREYTKGGDAR